MNSREATIILEQAKSEEMPYFTQQILNKEFDELWRSDVFKNLSNISLFSQMSSDAPANQPNINSNITAKKVSSKQKQPKKMFCDFRMFYYADTGEVVVPGTIALHPSNCERDKYNKYISADGQRKIIHADSFFHRQFKFIDNNQQLTRKEKRNIYSDNGKLYFNGREIAWQQKRKNLLFLETPEEKLPINPPNKTA